MTCRGLVMGVAMRSFPCQEAGGPPRAPARGFYPHLISDPKMLAQLFLIVFASAASYKCNTADDCEMLGECVTGQCKCFPGFNGPSCAQIDLLPSLDSEFSAAAWPPAGGCAMLNKTQRAYGWGFSVARDATSPTLLHAVANVGCYLPNSGMVTGTFLMHLTSIQGPTGPWKAVGIVAPMTTFNAHLRLAPSGDCICFLPQQ
jgi:hypothetical protein